MLIPELKATRSLALVNVNVATAAEVCTRFYLDKRAMQLLQSGMSPRDYLEALVENQEYFAAMDFIAHALPHRHSIWWGCLCLQHTCGTKLEPWERVAARAVVQWILQPNEANRVAAKRSADVLGFGSPAGALASAANQTGGSLAPPNLPPVGPSPFAPARAVALAVKVASTKGDPPALVRTQRGLIELGIAVAEGRFPPWTLG